MQNALRKGTILNFVLKNHVYINRSYLSERLLRDGNAQRNQKRSSVSIRHVPRRSACSNKAEPRVA